MNKVLLSMIVLLCLIAFAGQPGLASDDAAQNGIVVEERILNLPQDETKWHISVIGSHRLLFWFDNDDRLKRIKDQVHFHPVVVGSDLFEKRYAKNIEGLPTVRVQEADGTVVYEAAGKTIPYSAGGLYGAIAGAAQQAQGIFPILPWRRGRSPWLPWRREMDERCRPNPGPEPRPEPAPEPLPEPDDGGVPIFDEPSNSSPTGLIVFLVSLSAVLGSVIGLVVQWKVTYDKV